MKHIIFTIITCLLCPLVGNACECGNTYFLWNFLFSKQTVFTGTITNIEEVNGYQKLYFKVNKNYKNAEQSEIAVVAPINGISCGYPDMHINDKWLIVAKYSNGALYTNHCSDSRKSTSEDYNVKVKQLEELLYSSNKEITVYKDTKNKRSSEKATGKINSKGQPVGKWVMKDKDITVHYYSSLSKLDSTHIINSLTSKIISKKVFHRINLTVTDSTFNEKGALTSVQIKRDSLTQYGLLQDFSYKRFREGKVIVFETRKDTISQDHITTTHKSTLHYEPYLLKSHLLQNREPIQYNKTPLEKRERITFYSLADIKYNGYRPEWATQEKSSIISYYDTGVIKYEDITVPSGLSISKYHDRTGKVTYIRYYNDLFIASFTNEADFSYWQSKETKGESGFPIHSYAYRDKPVFYKEIHNQPNFIIKVWHAYRNDGSLAYKLVKYPKGYTKKIYSREGKFKKEVNHEPSGNLTKSLWKKYKKRFHPVLAPTKNPVAKEIE